MQHVVAGNQVQRAEADRSAAAAFAASAPFRTLFEPWLADSVSRKDAKAALRQTFEKDVLPTIRDTPVRELGNAQLLDLLRNVGREGGGARPADRMLTEICQMVRWAIKRQPRRPLLAHGNPAEFVELKQWSRKATSRASVNAPFLPMRSGNSETSLGASRCCCRCREIRLAFKGGALDVSMTWPVSAAADCAALHRECCVDLHRRLVAVNEAYGHALTPNMCSPTVVHALGNANAHHDNMLANARVTHIKMLVHDGFDVRCAARRLNVGRFVWPREIDMTKKIALTQA